MIYNLLNMKTILFLLDLTADVYTTFFCKYFIKPTR